MQIEMVATCELKEYENNARTHSPQQVQEIVDSIKNFGFNDPVEIDSAGVILSGHARVRAAVIAGLSSVPCVRHNHLSGDATAAYILAANRVALSAGWDADILKHEFNFLLDNNFDLSLTGFTQDELEHYLHPEILNPGIGDADSVPDVAEEAICKRGDLWILGNHRLRCGDSTLYEDVIDVLDQGAIVPTLMCTDPPYGVEYDLAWREGVDLGVGQRSKGKVRNDECVDWTEAYCLFPGNVVYVWHAGKHSHTVARNLEDCGFNIVSQIIWAKQHFAISRGDYHWQHEPCWYAVRQGSTHNWNGARDQSTLWEIKNNNAFGNANTEETWGYGTQKPIECMERPIKNNTKPDNWVYDPFGGSGTTLIACEKLGRRCTMIELDEKYCDVIIKRWQKFTGKKAILKTTGEEFNS